MQLINTSRLSVVEYFDDLVNQIDINIENHLLNQHLSINQQENLNSIRNLYLSEIFKIKKYNLDRSLEFKNFRESEISTKDSSNQGDVFCFLIDHSLFNYYSEKLNKVGVLVVTDFYLSLNMINRIQDIIHEEWQFMNGVSLEPFLRAKHILLKELIYGYEIINKIIERKDSNQIIRISKKIDKPIRLKELILTKIEDSLLDEFPIVELDIKYIDDLLSINKSSNKFNYTLECLQVHHIKCRNDNYESKLFELNLAKLKSLKKLRLHKQNQLGIDKLVITDNSFSQIDNLEELHLSDSFLGILLINRPHNLNNLRKLSLNDIPLSNRFTFNNCETEASDEIKKRYERLENFFHSMINLTSLELEACNLTYLDLGFLRNLHNLEILKLSNNLIQFKESKDKFSEAFQLQLKPFKNLKKLKELNLSRHILLRINNSLFEGLDNLEVLYLNDNNILVIEENTFIALKKLKILDLSENLPKEFSRNSFKGLDSLENFYFESCLLSKYNIFEDMPNLKIVSLMSREDKNYCFRKETIPERVFDGLKNLEKFSCGTTQFIMIDGSNIFEKIYKNIKELNINITIQNNNNIEHACADFLHELTKLTKLTMRIEPQVETLYSSMFNNNFESLTSLHLNNIGFSHLEDGIFDRLINLKMLSLRENKLRYLDGTKLFKNLTKLEYLDLESNQMREITPFSFDGLVYLEYLNILSNPVTNIDQNMFDRLCNLRELLIEIHDVSLSKECFKNLLKLNQLTISFQDVNIGNSDLFSCLENLNNLTITVSWIHKISEDFLSCLRSLTYLCIENCPISDIHPRALENLKSLRVLKLNQLLINEFDSKLIRNLKSLRFLELKKNKLLNKINIEKIEKQNDIRKFIYCKNMLQIGNSKKMIIY